MLSAVISLPGGGEFRIQTQTADGGQIGAEDIYILGITLDGEPFTGTALPLSSIRPGGSLVFTMGPEPKESSLH